MANLSGTEENKGAATERGRRCTNRARKRSDGGRLAVAETVARGNCVQKAR